MQGEMRTPVEEVAIPLTFDDDKPSIEIEFKSTDELQADFESGMLSADDFEEPTPRAPEDYGPDEGVPVFPVELPPVPEVAGPECELLLDHAQAEALLDSLTAGEWRRWPGRPPTLRASGVGWQMSAWSEHDLRRWVERRLDAS